MPGATVESFDGETIVGRVKVKVGPIQVMLQEGEHSGRHCRAGQSRFPDDRIPVHNRRGDFSQCDGQGVVPGSDDCHHPQRASTGLPAGAG